MSVDDTNSMDMAEIIRLPSTKVMEPEEMIPVFELDDEIYEVPKRPSAGLALQYLKIQTEEGPDTATYWMLVTMLGEDAYNTLSDHPSLSSEHLKQVIDLLEKHLLGGAEGKEKAEIEKEKRRRRAAGGRRRPVSRT